MTRFSALLLLGLLVGSVGCDSESSKLNRYMAARAEVHDLDIDIDRCKHLLEMEVNYPEAARKSNETHGKTDWGARIAEHEATQQRLFEIMRDNRPSTVLNKNK